MAPAFAITNSQWMEVKDQVLREVELEVVEYHEGTALTVSETFENNLKRTMATIESEMDFPWIEIQEALTIFLNQSLEETDPDIREALVAYAQDYNAARSNKPTSEVFIDEDSDDDGLDDGTQEDQLKAQDYNSSRSKKPNTEVFVGDEDLDSDGDGIDDGMIDFAERIEIRIPIDSSGITMMENIEIEKLDIGPKDGNADIILAMIYADSLQDKIKSSGMLSQCELNDKGIAFYSGSQDGMDQQYLRDQFFIPLGVGGDLDCDDDGLDDIRPDEIMENDLDDERDRRIVLRTGEEKVDSSNTEKVLEVAPFIQNDRTMVPFRFIGEELGAEIEWHNEERKVEYRLDGNILELWIGENTARLNGEAVMVDEDSSINPFIINSRTVVPIRFISEALGFEVLWNNETREITIQEGNPLYQGETQEGVNPLYQD